MVRFTDAEYASISISAEQAGYPVAVYVRKSALDERIEVHYNITAELPELQKLIAEYSAIGNNLNQIPEWLPPIVLRYWQAGLHRTAAFCPRMLLL